MTKATDTIDTLSFEAALAELEGIVRALESGQTPLAQSITAYERGITLKKHCEKQLADARLRVEKITLSADGTATGTTPFNPE
jgi:exodeoxyribonuclease VII small subunit